MNGEPSSARGRFQLVNQRGLHARAATRLVEVASRHACEVWVCHEGHTANAKSVMGVLLLCGSPGAWLEVQARGEGAEAAVRAVGELIEARFGEDW